MKQTLIPSNKKKFTDLSDNDCLEIAKIITDNIATKISRIDRHPDQNWLEIFCDNTTEKINIRGFKDIAWLEKDSKTGKWISIAIYNYIDFINFLLEHQIIEIQITLSSFYVPDKIFIEGKILNEDSVSVRGVTGLEEEE